MAHPKYWYFVAQIIRLFACDFNIFWQGGESRYYEHHQILGKMDPKNMPSVSPGVIGGAGRKTLVPTLATVFMLLRNIRASSLLRFSPRKWRGAQKVLFLVNNCSSQTHLVLVPTRPIRGGALLQARNFKQRRSGGILQGEFDALCLIWTVVGHSRGETIVWAEVLVWAAGAPSGISPDPSPPLPL